LKAGSYTNSSLATARRCLHEFELRYMHQLEREGDLNEALHVGQTWHKAHECETAEDGHHAIAKHAPGKLWQVKLSRLFAAHHWYWDQRDPLKIVERERTFAVTAGDTKFRGQIDAIVELADGWSAILERKTTGFDIAPSAPFWNRLRLDVQVGLYAMAFGVTTGNPLPPIIYDVVRKPTINPKRLTKAEISRLRKDLDKNDGHANYYQEIWSADIVEPAIFEGRESPELYGSRLTADIGDRPDYYFARREVSRSFADYSWLKGDILSQVEAIEHLSKFGHLPRNPDSCHAFGLCDFFPLCSNNICPTVHEEPPDGFRRRDLLHPELPPEPEQTE